jgi:hypothetical protein
MLSHIQPSALVGLVAGQAGHALGFGGILMAQPLAQVLAVYPFPSAAPIGL